MYLDPLLWDNRAGLGIGALFTAGGLLGCSYDYSRLPPRGLGKTHRPLAYLYAGISLWVRGCHPAPPQRTGDPTTHGENMIVSGTTTIVVNAPTRITVYYSHDLPDDIGPDEVEPHIEDFDLSFRYARSQPGLTSGTVFNSGDDSIPGEIDAAIEQAIQEHIANR